MFRGNWNRPRYSAVVQGEGGGGGGGGSGLAAGSGGHVGQSDNESDINTAAMSMLREDRIGRAEASKFLFQQRLKMEDKRRQLAKGNILTFLLDPSILDSKKTFLNKVLRIAGFAISDVTGVKLNDYRGNQAEVLFKPEVKIDIEEIETKLNKNKDIDNKIKIAKFNDKEDIIMVYGLPLSDRRLAKKCQLGFYAIFK